MRIRLVAEDVERSFDTQLNRFTDAETIPCHRCGVCCQRWQPLITVEEAEELARFLDLDVQTFLTRYGRPYPLVEDGYVLNQVDGGCVFLRFEGTLAVCTVHEARPVACRDWDASLRRKECIDGLGGAGGPHGLVLPLPLYEADADNQIFLRQLRG
jgi:Fe-S-cluster containining protein